MSRIDKLMRYPAGLLVQALGAKFFGDVRTKERYHIFPRPQYAYGILRAADLARFVGKKQVLVCEFGVAKGAGLLAMADLAQKIGAFTGVDIRVIGFDTGQGMPVCEGYRDHPEYYVEGDFSMEDPDALRAKLGDRGELIIGDIADTMPAFVETLTPDCPVGFLSIDVDTYTSTNACFGILEHENPEVYPPAVPIYLDDIAIYFANRWAGELLSVDEFNERNPMRKIDEDRTLPGHRPIRSAPFYPAMHICHVLDHPFRAKPTRAGGVSLEEHKRILGALHPMVY